MTIEQFETNIKNNADALIALGKEEWMRMRKRRNNKSQQDRVREIEDKLIDDGVIHDKRKKTSNID
jgi:hypothetical protein